MTVKERKMQREQEHAVRFLTIFGLAYGWTQDEEAPPKRPESLGRTESRRDTTRSGCRCTGGQIASWSRNVLENGGKQAGSWEVTYVSHSWFLDRCVLAP